MNVYTTAAAIRGRIAGVLCLLSLGGCPPAADSYRSALLELRFNIGPAQPALVAAHAAPAAFRSEPVFESIPGKRGSHAPTLVVLPDGELLAAWYAYDGPRELDGADIYTARRAPGAQHWDPPRVHLDRRESVGNPVVYGEGDDLWMFFAVVPGVGWSTAHIEVQRSSDRGLTWSAPAAVGTVLGGNVRFSPVRLRTGELLLPAYDDLLQRSLFYASTDGESWSLRSIARTAPAYPCLQPSVVELPGGRLLAVMRNGGGGWLWVTASDDEGRTWAVPADAGFPNPGAPAQVFSLASGNLLLVFNDSPDARAALSATLSADAGATWLRPKPLVEQAGEHAYPSVGQTPDGRIHVLYSHARQRIEHITLNEAWLAREE